MSDILRTANLLAALAGVLIEKMDSLSKGHHNQTDTAMAALNIISHFEGCSIAQLGAALKLSHSATVRLVNKLREAGLVNIADGPDRRTLALQSTKEGRAHAADMVSMRVAAVASVLECLEPAQRLMLTSTVSTLLERLTFSPLEAAHICRLCDDDSCPAELCPVHLRAEALLADSYAGRDRDTSNAAI